MWSNFHTHSHYCDGKGSIREYLDAALDAKIEYIGFSSHAPLPFSRNWSMDLARFPHYLQEIETLKPSYPGLAISTGLEVDFIPQIIHPGAYRSRLDYTIGSIHFVDSFENIPWEIDNTFDVFREGLSKIFHDDIRKAIRRYYALTREMLRISPPDILGHLDKIKINCLGQFFDESESWYREEIDKTISAIGDTRTIVEVNTRGQYKKKSATTYPSPWILERIFHAGIPVTLNSDAHHPGDLTRGFGPARAFLKEIGFKTLSVLDSGRWKELSLDEYGAES